MGRQEQIQETEDKSAIILIVDDVAMNRQLLGTLLRKAGYQVVSASNANQALVQLSLQTPDLILMDIMMPGIDGYTLAGRLLKDPRTSHVPIIFLSALSEGQDKVRAFELGGADYVTKPFNADEVLVRVAHQIRIARLQRALEREKDELARSNALLVNAQRRTAAVFGALSERFPGTTLDNKYRIETLIGRGGFGVVYKATHVALDRKVAVKIFQPTETFNADALARFRVEGISACRVNHRNAVAVLDSGMSQEGIAYLVMELLNGPTLFEEMQCSGQMSVQRCLELMIPLCEVLAAAHAAGIVHRDVKPENILMHQTEDGGELLKVLDFGIAKLIEPGDQPAGPLVTQRDQFFGTPIYTAPERLDGSAYDGRSDVYSAGVMLYEMLCAEVPFADKNQSPLKNMFNHLHTPPIPMSRHREDIPESLATLVTRSLSKDPQRRPTAQEFRDALIRIF